MTESNNKDDNTLEDYLAGDSELSRQYRDGDRPEPSAAIDRAILDAARDAVSDPATPPGRRPTLMWERPWAIAAVVALSAILVVSIQREAGLFAPEDVAVSQSVDSLELDSQPSGEPASPAMSPPQSPARQADLVTHRRELSDEAVRIESPKPGAAPAVDGIVANGVLERERPDNAAGASVAAKAPEEELTRTGARVKRSDLDDEVTIEDLLNRIKTTWQDGDEERAQELLDAFRKQYPDFDDEQLHDSLPAALMDRALRQEIQ